MLLIIQLPSDYDHDGPYSECLWFTIYVNKPESTTQRHYQYWAHRPQKKAHTTQPKIKENMINTDPITKLRDDTRHATPIVKTYWTQLYANKHRQHIQDISLRTNDWG
jgi:hypothetical protein